ncbi:MAG: hypothetical protein R3E68_08980 [Burkholderiaceae bacterium]
MPTPADVGRWIDWPLIAAASLMPDGKGVDLRRPGWRGVVQSGRGSTSWEPAYGRATDAHYTITNAQGVDSFARPPLEHQHRPAAGGWRHCAARGHVHRPGGQDRQGHGAVDGLRSLVRSSITLG